MEIKYIGTIDFDDLSPESQQKIKKLDQELFEDICLEDRKKSMESLTMLEKFGLMHAMVQRIQQAIDDSDRDNPDQNEAHEK